MVYKTIQKFDLVDPEINKCNFERKCIQTATFLTIYLKNFKKLTNGYAYFYSLIKKHTRNYFRIFLVIPLQTPIKCQNFTFF